MIPEHHIGDQHFFAQIPAFQLGDQILPGDQPGYRDAATEKVVLNGDDRST